MKWLNLDITKLRNAEFLGSEATVRGAWVSLMAYCAEQENGGQIRGFYLWPPNKVMITSGCERAIFEQESDLWSRDGDDITLIGYPYEQEAKVMTRREAGKKGGQARTQAKRDAAKANGQKGGRTKGEAESNEVRTQAKNKLRPSKNPTEEEEEEERKGKSKGKDTNSSNEECTSPDGEGTPSNPDELELDGKAGTSQPPNAPLKAIVECYNRLCASQGMTAAKVKTDSRAAAIRAFWRRVKCNMDGVEAYFAIAAASDFLCGRTRRGGFKNCNLDWLIKQSNYVKVVEGNYDNGKE